MAMRPACKTLASTFFEANVRFAALTPPSRVLELILMGDNDRSMLDFGAGATHGRVKDTLVRSTRGGCSA
eukprot:2267440-Prymnesium_polylepis.1